MKVEILTHSHPKETKPLIDHPQKDGSETSYRCGLLLIGGWATRLEEHREFCATPIGKYILKLENNRGGKREGSGRKKKEPTVVKRIPISQVKNVEQILKKSNGK